MHPPRRVSLLLLFWGTLVISRWTAQGKDTFAMLQGEDTVANLFEGFVVMATDELRGGMGGMQAALEQDQVRDQDKVGIKFAVEFIQELLSKRAELEGGEEEEEEEQA